MSSVGLIVPAPGGGVSESLWQGLKHNFTAEWLWHKTPNCIKGGASYCLWLNYSSVSYLCCCDTHTGSQPCCFGNTEPEILSIFTFDRWRPQSGTQSINISVTLLDPSDWLCSPQLHEGAQLLQRAAELHLVVGLATSAMFGPTKRVVGHVFFLWDSTEAFPKNKDSVVGRSCRSGLTGTLWL